jgi:ABC-type proline/glycine betaine transport system ATPase subunit
VLAEVGLVSSRKEGRQRIYSELPAGMSQLRLELERFWTKELDLLVADATFSASDP